MAMQNDETSVASSPVDRSKGTGGNYLRRLCRGDVPLVITYWVWGVLVGGVGFTVLNAIVEVNYLRISTMAYGTIGIVAFYILGMAFAVFLWVAIWRSAGKYEGEGWGAVARVAVVLGVLMGLGQVALVVLEDEAAALVEQTRLANRGLPMMLDQNTRLDSVRLIPDEYRYWNTLMNSKAAELEQNAFVLRSRIALSDNLCDDADTRAALDAGVTFFYVYNDTDGDLIAEVPVTVIDCD